MKKENVIQVVKVEPGKNPEIVKINNELEIMQGIVGGYIEPLQIAEGVCIVCNEEGKINGLPLNRALRDDEGEIWEIIAGTFFITGDDYSIGEFVSLTDEQAEHYKEMFHFPELFYMMGNKVCGKKVPRSVYEVYQGMAGDDI